MHITSLAESFHATLLLTGNIYCDGGSYCPDPVSKLPCKEGYFCKQGSNSMTACPALAECPAGTETPSDNYAGIILDACLFAVLGILWHASSLYNRIVTRLNSKERIRVMWHKMRPQVGELVVVATNVWADGALVARSVWAGGLKWIWK